MIELKRSLQNREQVCNDLFVSIEIIIHNFTVINYVIKSRVNKPELNTSNQKAELIGRDGIKFVENIKK